LIILLDLVVIKYSVTVFGELVTQLFLKKKNCLNLFLEVIHLKYSPTSCKIFELSLSTQILVL